MRATTRVNSVERKSCWRVELSALRGTASARSTRASQESVLRDRARDDQERALDGVDRDDANTSTPSRGGFFAAPGGKLVGACEAQDMIVGIGIDLAEVERYRFDERALAWFARKIYTEEEMRYAMRKRNWPERLAGFFAAKEATRKAFGHAIPWRWVGVTHERSGKPSIRCSAKRSACCGARVAAIHLTITHTATTAAAVVILERDLRPDAARRCGPPTPRRARARRGRADAAAGAAHRAARARARAGRARIVAFAGPGNNGGDAFAALARARAAYERMVYAAPRRHRRRHARGEPRARGRRARRAVPADDARRATRSTAPRGRRRALRHRSAPAACRGRSAPRSRALDARRVPVLAVDIPTRHRRLERRGRARRRTRDARRSTLAALKPGLLLEPARANVRRTVVRARSASTMRRSPRTRARSRRSTTRVTRAASGARARCRQARAGAPLVVAGSAQFPGAAVLCARAAARAGAGYVTVATSRAAAAPLLRAHLVEQVVVESRRRCGVEAARRICSSRPRTTAPSRSGPGWGSTNAPARSSRAFVAECELPIVLDASALFHFAKHLDLLRGKRCVLTPHAGEFARLSGHGTIAPGKRVARLREFVDRTGVTTLLKGPRHA